MKTLLLSAFLLIPFATDAATNCVLTWTVTTDTNVAGYHVYYGCASGNYTNKLTVSGITNNSVQISNLKPWRLYFFAATSFDSSGLESLLSNQVVLTNSGSPPLNLRIEPLP